MLPHKRKEASPDRRPAKRHQVLLPREPPSPSQLPERNIVDPTMSSDDIYRILNEYQQNKVQDQFNEDQLSPEELEQSYTVDEGILAAHIAQEKKAQQNSVSEQIKTLREQIAQKGGRKFFPFRWYHSRSSAYLIHNRSFSVSEWPAP